jgi:phage-related protein
VAAVRVVFYREGGRVPVREWLDSLPRDAREWCHDRLALLREFGHALRRPPAARVHAGLYELRAKHRRLNLRMLYFFHGQTVVVISRGFAKQQATIPLAEIRRALECRERFESDPQTHTAGAEG